MKRIITVLTGILFCLSLSGCSKRVDGEQSALTVPDFKPLNSIEDGRKNVYLIVKNLDSSYWNVMIEGAKDGGDDFDCNVYYSGTYVKTDWEGQARLLDDAAAAGADAILLAPDDSVRLSEKIDETYQKGVPIILLDTIANTDSYDICYMTDNLMAGQQAAEEMIAQLKKTAWRTATAYRSACSLARPPHRRSVSGSPDFSNTEAATPRKHGRSFRTSNAMTAF